MDESKPRLRRIFAGVFGCYLGVVMLKFGNPPIMEKWVTAPGSFLEFVIGSPWPIAWGYSALAVIALAGLGIAQWRVSPPQRRVLVLPLVWLVWELAASVRSIDHQLSYPTLVHLFACCICFYAGCFCLGELESGSPFWAGVLAGFLLALATGFEQQFGGLEQTRRYFYAYIYPQLHEVSPDYLKKMSSNRIFSTLFYPNAFAGAILLFTPPVLSVIAGARRRFTFGARVFLVTVCGLASLACLVWSGSKGGWLLCVLLILLALLRLSFSRRLKVLLLGALLFAGLAGFGWKYAGYLRKGATSVVARFDYWEAAFRTAMANPLLGTGPGTFAKPYQVLKRPESEMARLVHNDYLEQASDSGWPGFLAYTAFITAALVYAYPRKPTAATRPAGTGAVPMDAEEGDWHRWAVYLGLLGWALQGLFEFGLYIPALAWPAFTMLGWLLCRPAGSTPQQGASGSF